MGNLTSDCDGWEESVGVLTDYMAIPALYAAAFIQGLWQGLCQIPGYIRAKINSCRARVRRIRRSQAGGNTAREARLEAIRPSAGEKSSRGDCGCGEYVMQESGGETEWVCTECGSRKHAELPSETSDENLRDLCRRLVAKVGYGTGPNGERWCDVNRTVIDDPETANLLAEIEKIVTD